MKQPPRDVKEELDKLGAEVSRGIQQMREKARVVSMQVKTSKLADRFRGFFTKKKPAATLDAKIDESKADDSIKEAQVIDDGFMPADKPLARSFSVVAREDDPEKEEVELDDDSTMKLDKEQE